MVIRSNPLLDAIQKAKESGMSDDELEALKRSLGIGSEINPTDPIVEIRDIEGVKPVTTLKTIEHEEFSLQAPGGPIATEKQRAATQVYREQIQNKEGKPPVK